MDTISIKGNPALNGQNLAFEGVPIDAHFLLGDYPNVAVNNASGKYTWTIGDRKVETTGVWYDAAVSSYTPTQADVGKTISVTGSVAYVDGIHTSSSPNALTVVNVNDLPTGTVTITGDTAHAGSQLHAVSTIADEDGMGTLSYQWKANGRAILGATGDTWTLDAAHAGQAISVVASYVDGYGQAESVASDADPKAVHQNSPGALVVSGELAKGHTLHAQIVDTDPFSKAYYQWQIDDGTGHYVNVTGNWSADFTLGDSVPPVMRVIATYADRYGFIETHVRTIGTEGPDTIRGDMTPGEVIQARGGDDTLIYTSGAIFDGGDGIDTFYGIGGSSVGQLDDHTWYFLTMTTHGSWLVNIERVIFGEPGASNAEGVALDYYGHGGQAYRLYQAAFNRTPDKVGEGFWMSRLDKGVSLTDVANAFVASDEFKALYGTNPTNAAIVDKFYHNVLHRDPDPQSTFWVDVLDRKAATVAEVLIGFSESAENVAALVGVQKTGIPYLPYHDG
ncbi:DUF4214 domain-containing protein [Massilia putida]|uniref:DUF4214 domain-containing protein n=1 Tax=Massilia putida TaxID=1141883 RepID=UPI000952208C|nr:DUF4214 domain-containing protein [Massilia putida]